MRLRLGIPGEAREKEDIAERVEKREMETDLSISSQSRLFLEGSTAQSERGPNRWPESEGRETELHSVVQEVLRGRCDDQSRPDGPGSR